MPRIKYPGIKSVKLTSKVERTEVSFQRITEHSLMNKLIKPLHQGAMQEIKVNEMVAEYLENPHYWTHKQIVTISILNDSYQCMGSPYGTQVYIGSLDDNCLFIPSVFTPNGDGINDTWQIDGINLYSNPNIRVFNRWGQKVFESLSQLYVPWDGIGINNEEQEIATYYYVIDLNLDNKNYNGSVTIKR